MNQDPLPSCEQEGGFLFSHACGLPAGTLCSRCGKRVCDVHLAAEAEGMFCQTCAEEEDDDEGDGHEEGSDASEDDPSYYYEDYGYYGSGSSWSQGSQGSQGSSGSGHDPHDFTEADGESLRHEDDAAFEEDLGGS